MKNLEIFRKFCGMRSMKNVVILSTFWDRSMDTAIEHEKKLKSTPEFWGSMIECGAMVRRNDGNYGDWVEILSTLVSKPETTLDIQRQLFDEGKPLRDTAAGSFIYSNLRRLEEERLNEFARVQDQTVGPSGQYETNHESETEH